jgi:site-specific recombinase XerD
MHLRAASRSEEVRSLLGHARIDTTPVYTSIKPSQLKRAVAS